MPESSVHPATIRLQTSWSIEIGRLRFAVMRDREVERGMRFVAPRRSGWPFGAGALTGVGTVALLVAAASAAPRDMKTTRYTISVPVPAPAPHRIAQAVSRKPIGRTALRPAGIALSAGDRFDAGDEPHVVRAMATGTFQEWDDPLGQRRFLTAGPARAEHGRFCRDMALLVRLAEGGSRVRSATRCTTEPVSEPSVEQPNSEGSDDDPVEPTGL